MYRHRSNPRRFKNLGLPTIGTLLNNADLSLAKKTLSINEAESFISGIFDTRGSLAKSHRRFADDAPVVSLEITEVLKTFNSLFSCAHGFMN